MATKGTLKYRKVTRTPQSGPNKNEKNKGKTLAVTVDDGCTRNLSDYLQQHYSENNFNSSDNWILLNPIETSIKNKIEQYGTPLSEWNIQINYGIKTGYNDAFIIDESTKNAL